VAPNPVISRLKFLHLCALTGLFASGCVTPKVDDLVEAECFSGDDCAGDRACVDGACVTCGEERCDGFDNDCDGRVDEDFNLATSAEHCGACGAACGGICRGGVCEIPDLGPDAARCDPVEETCNGADDDCDGETDEGVTNACGACGPLPDEVCNEADDDCDGEVDEGVTNACDVCGPVPEEICNGEDDDCDDLTDEGVANACGACGAVPAEVCDGVDNDCDEVVDEDIAPEAAPPEICNAADDDCDGATDEGFEGLEEACEVGVGACFGEGTVVCNEAADGVRCDAEEGAPAAEGCNGVDDDCDGATDEDFAVREAGLPALGDVCQPGEGACLAAAPGEIVCDPEDPAHVTCSSPEQPPVPEICNLLDDDCDGTSDEGFDLLTDAAHCGLCDRECAGLPNAEGVCVEGQCTRGPCDPGFEDVDGLDENGCECEPGANDVPDRERADPDCDGIDGVFGQAIFVRPGGDDGGDGTALAPVATFGRALELVEDGRRQVLVAAGEYVLPATLEVGVEVALYGGYQIDDAGVWTRGPFDPQSTVVRGGEGVTTVLRTEAGARLTLAELQVVGGAADAGRTSSITIVVRGGALALIDTRVLASAGGPGASGAPGGQVVTGGVGGDGAPGSLDGSAGAGGTNEECAPSHGGGAGGVGTAADGSAPEPGAPGEPEAEGGDGGNAASAELGALPGGGVRGRATAGAHAEPAATGGSVDIDGGEWRPFTGEQATVGSPGAGGGGGGGGFSPTLGEIAPGGAGGGAGGCGGTGGTTASGGAASIAVMVVGPAALDLTRAALQAGGGGPGGEGGEGGDGSVGGAGGRSTVGPEGTQPGAGGGSGGQGGCGGAGAGGHGGHSIALLLVDPAAIALQADPETLMAPGPAGPPGAGGGSVCAEQPAPPGADGVSFGRACCADADDCGDFACPAD